MNALAVFDCLRVVPDRYALVAAAAARAHALRRGQTPRIATTTASAPLTALQEIAAGAITAEEIRQFLSSPPDLSSPHGSEAPPLPDSAGPERDAPTGSDPATPDRRESRRLPLSHRDWKGGST